MEGAAVPAGSRGQLVTGVDWVKLDGPSSKPRWHERWQGMAPPTFSEHTLNPAVPGAQLG